MPRDYAFDEIQYFVDNIRRYHGLTLERLQKDIKRAWINSLQEELYQVTHERS